MRSAQRAAMPGACSFWKWASRWFSTSAASVLKIPIAGMPSRGWATCHSAGLKTPSGPSPGRSTARLTNSEPRT